MVKTSRSIVITGVASTVYDSMHNPLSNAYSLLLYLLSGQWTLTPNLYCPHPITQARTAKTLASLNENIACLMSIRLCIWDYVTVYDWSISLEAFHIVYFVFLSNPWRSSWLVAHDRTYWVCISSLLPSSQVTMSDGNWYPIWRHDLAPISPSIFDLRLTQSECTRLVFIDCGLSNTAHPRVTTANWRNTYQTREQCGLQYYFLIQLAFSWLICSIILK